MMPWQQPAYPADKEARTRRRADEQAGETMPVSGDGQKH